MAISTYAELQTEIENHLKRSGLTARIPVYIQLAEARMNRDLRSRSMMAEATLNPSTTVKTLALPTGWMETISFYDDLGEELEAVTLDELGDLRYGQGTSRPKYYCITSQINFDRVADATYNYVMWYYKRLDLATDLSNTVLTNAPDVYLYGSLIASAPDIKDENRIALWSELYTSAFKALNHQEVQSRRALRTDFGGRSFNIVRGY